MAASSSSAPATTDIYKSFPSLKGRTAKFTSTAPFTPTYIQAHTPTNSSSYTNRIQGHQILLENPARESQDKKDRDARRARQKRDGARRKAGIISRADAKRLGAWKLDRNACKYVVTVGVLPSNVFRSISTQLIHWPTIDMILSSRFIICGARTLQSC